MKFFELVPPGTNIDFVGRWRACAIGSLTLIAICAAAIPIRGVRLGVDFAGGTQLVVRVQADPPADEAGVRAALVRAGYQDAAVIRAGAREEGMFQIRIPQREGVSSDEIAPRAEAELASLGTTTIESVDFVGARVGDELRRGAIVSLGLSFLLILVYVAVRFAPSYAPGAVVALIHDVAVTAGLFVLFGWEFDLNVVAALLTIIGYSLNDTIVIYDRIRENRELRTSVELTELVNRSVNETLSRTILTAGATLLSVLALVALGGSELRLFSLAMAIGIVAGCYSTVYVASPLVIWIEGRRRAVGERKPGRAEPTPRARRRETTR